MKSKVILRLGLLLGLLLLAGIWAVNAQRNRVVKALINEVNKEIKGHISYGDVEITGIGKFPEIGLRVHDVILHQSETLAISDTVAQIDYMYVGVPLSSIWSKNFTIEDVYLNGGRMVLVDEWNGKLSIEEALALKKPFTERGDSDRGKNPLLLSIDSVHARDFQFIYRAERFKDELKLRIQSLDAEFKQHGDSTIASATVITYLEEQLNRNDDAADRERLEGRVRVNADVVVTKNDLRISNIDLLARQLLYHSDSGDVHIDSVAVKAPELYYPLRSGPLLTHFTLDGSVELRSLKVNPFSIALWTFSVSVDNGTYEIRPRDEPLFGIPGEGRLRVKPFDSIPSYDLDLRIPEFEMKALMDNAFDSIPFFGKGSLHIDLDTRGYGAGALANLNGSVLFQGEDFILTDIDIDKFIRKFKRSQNFNLVDVGAVLVAGPIGLAATKGGAYANLALFSKGDTTHVRQLISKVDVADGRIELTDVAMATLETRIAGSGYVDLAQDTLEIFVDVVNRVGCSVVGQDVYGSTGDVQRSRVKIVKTLLGPVENFLKDVSIVDCKPVYQGSVPPPPTKAELRKIKRAAKKAANNLST